MRFTSLLLLCVGLAVPLAAQGCGWRGDGTGVFPTADPPRTWSEDEHVAWKTPLPNWGNGSPVVGGPNVYVLCEPTEETPAPILVAIDRDSGAIRWRTPVDHFAAPGADQAVQEEWHALQRRGWRIMRTLLEFRAALRGGDTAAAEAAVAAGGKLGVRIEQGKQRKGRITVKAHIDRRAIHRLAERLRAHGIRPLKWEVDILNPKSISEPKPDDHTWCANWAGQTFCAPVADDGHVWVVTGRNAAACFSHDGTRRWLTWIRPRAGELKAANEDHVWGNGPFLAGDRLVVYSGRSVHALDKTNGKILWTFELPMKPDGVDGRSFTTIVPVTVGGTTYGCLVLDKLYLFDLATGEDLLAGETWARLGRAHSPGVLGPTICTNYEKVDGLVCLRFARAGDGIAVEKLWNLPKRHTRHSPTGWQGRFYTSCGTFDLSGEQVRKHGSGGSRISPVLAAGRFHLVSSGRDRGLTCTVLDAQSGKRLAANTLEFTEPTGAHLDRVRAHAGADRWYYFTMAAPLPHGDSLYLRSMDHLYRLRD